MSDTFAYGELTTFGFGSVVVAKVLSIDGPEVKVNKIDKTVLGDTIKTYRPGLVDVGSITLTVQYDPTEHNSLKTACEAKTKQSSPTLTFYSDAGSSIGNYTWDEGYIESYKVTGMTQDGNVQAQISVWVQDVPA